MNYKEISSVLFVCMGNICRSPSAEAVFRHKAHEQGLNLQIDSAGTIGSHAREKPDHRAQKVGISRGYSFDKIKARKVTVEDFEKFDLILAMDKQNIKELHKVAPAHLTGKIKLFLDFSANFEENEVPDPYYGGAKGFQFVLDLVEDASDGLIKELTS
ncbi:low molecular weight protein-tyrosine-phosphatase [Colwellia sp. 1_MG-2023]|uniref:low molecular weight protein-tyrosine-phosphatase n=1 Tax=Colwellia sp. 1_MG-2023 TaxID=3062649 RepID=UPI0026E157F3|nr:low molecular weight protein-tyrosine-phosphatase [Colwellia sp. 1_MG-2023]MDO6446097.1 low molecular weight protein-tyrosine-phosphatase [Colwellia sp. 1_MG-2023]